MEGLAEIQQPIVTKIQVSSVIDAVYNKTYRRLKTLVENNMGDSMSSAAESWAGGLRLPVPMTEESCLEKGWCEVLNIDCIKSALSMAELGASAIGLFCVGVWRRSDIYRHNRMFFRGKKPYPLAEAERNKSEGIAMATKEVLLFSEYY